VCDVCEKALASVTVIGPKRQVRMCQACLDTWHVYRHLIYGAQERGPFDV
jgi:hypothetical protein